MTKDGPPTVTGHRRNTPYPGARTPRRVVGALGSAEPVPRRAEVATPVVGRHGEGAHRGRVPHVTGLLEGKVAVVAGGGRGMGEATSTLFTSSGAAVVVADKSHERAHRVADAIEAAGRRSVALHVDLRDADTPRRVVAAAIEAFGSLDIVVNVAGGMRGQRLATAPAQRCGRLGLRLPPERRMDPTVGRRGGRADDSSAPVAA